MKRLFFALWPNDAARQQCVALQKKLSFPSCQPVVNDNLHLTLVFLGSVEQRQKQALVTAAANIPIAPIEIVFDHLSFWKKPEVLCLTTNIFNSSLLEVVTKLNALAFQLDIPIENRPYRAHVTLVRKAKQTVLIDFEPIVWRADKFHLVESCSTPTGVVYRICHSWGGETLFA